MKVKRKKPLDNAPKWRDTFYVRAYILAREGLKDGAVAAALGVSRLSVVKWKKRNKAFRVALKLARKPHLSKTEAFNEFVLGRLPDRLKPLWDRLHAAETTANPERRTEELLAGQGEHVRQALFAHAFFAANFNKAEACRRAGVSYAAVKKWMTDPAFQELMGVLQEARKDFVEGCLLNLVAGGDTAATIFASKTINRDRGFDTSKKIVEHRVSGAVDHAISFEEMPVDIQRQIMAWADSTGKTPAALALSEHVEDAEVLGKE